MALDDDLTKAALTEVAKKAAAEAWEKKSNLLALLKRAWDFLRRRSATEDSAAETPSRGIVIVGPGGTGKSTLARVLAGDVNVLIDPPGFYEPDRDVQSLPLIGVSNAELVVMPGQSDRFGREFNQFATDLSSGKYRGVILVVDYGHHCIQNEWTREHELYKGNKKEFVAKLLESQLNEELELLDKLIPHLKQIARKLWMLVLVLKQDLWSPKQAEVVKHYRDGVWGMKVAELVQSLDPKLFDLHTVFACLHIQNYTTMSGRETLKKNAAGYDAIRQRESLVNLSQQFELLRKWEDQS